MRFECQSRTFLGQLLILWYILGGFLSSELIKGRIMKKKRRFINSPFTTKWPNACACPKTFAAEHLYTPASLPFTFCKLRIPPVTADCLICNLFGSLLHNTAGWGLPVAEHWNVADPLSFTVTLEGERATEGAENDSPGSPFVAKLQFALG